MVHWVLRVSDESYKQTQDIGLLMTSVSGAVER